MSAYRFPPVRVPDGTTLEQQLEHVKSEVREAKRAEIKCRFGGSDADTEALCMELLDVVHAAETALRMACPDEGTVDVFRAKVIEKNARRGYYEVVD